MKLTRRDALKGLGAAALAPLGAGLVTSGSASCGGGPLVLPAKVSDRIDTVVVLMMENRSFDHYFGARSLVEGRDCDGLYAGLSNARSDGTLVKPARADAFCVADPSHGWSASHRQFADGTNAGFVSEHEARHGEGEAHRAMGFFLREDLPTSYALADHYTLCDRWFASVMGPTWPNRYYSLLCTSLGNRSNDIIAEPLPPIFERVYRAGKSFGIYYGNMPFAILSPALSLDDPELVYLEQFFDDAHKGTLPNLCWIDPLYGKNDDHPPAHPKAGQVLINSIYQALAESPQWERCLFIVTYDEHGGFYDHVAPPLTSDDFASEGFDQLGFRVPSMLIGPYVKEGHVSRTVYDHTSIYRTLSHLWGMAPLSTRDQNASPIWDALDDERLLRADARAPVSLAPVIASDEEIYAAGCVTDLGAVGLSQQEGVTGQSGQRELEALAWRRFGPHPKNRLRESDEVHERLLAIAKDLGAYRPAAPK